MDNKKLKRIMTDLAAGHITKKEAEEQMEKPKKTSVRGPKQGKSATKKPINNKPNKKEVK